MMHFQLNPSKQHFFEHTRKRFPRNKKHGNVRNKHVYKVKSVHYRDTIHNKIFKISQWG